MLALLGDIIRRALWPILDRHTDNLVPGNRFYPLVPIPAHSICTYRLEAVINHDHRVSAQFGGFLAQLLFDIMAGSDGMSWNVNDDFTETVVGLSRLGAQNVHGCRIDRRMMRCVGIGRCGGM